MVLPHFPETIGWHDDLKCEESLPSSFSSMKEKKNAMYKAAISKSGLGRKK